MKRKLLMDILIYVTLPIIIYMYSGIQKFNSFISYFIIIGAIYTMYTKNRQQRANISGICAMITIILCIYFSKTYQGEYNLYIYKTYIIAILGIIVLSLGLIGKNICNQVYMDILNIKTPNNVAINNIIRKKRLENELGFLKNLIILHLWSVSLIRFYAIIHYGVSGYQDSNVLVLFSTTVFLGAEIYIICKILEKTMKDKIFYIPQNKKEENKAIVININQYRRVDK